MYTIEGRAPRRYVLGQASGPETRKPMEKNGLQQAAFRRARPLAIETLKGRREF